MAEVTLLLVLSIPVAFLWGTLLMIKRNQQKTTEYHLAASLKALGIVQINRGRR